MQTGWVRFFNRSSALTENLAQFTTYTLSLWYDQFVTIKIIHINKS